MVNPIPATTILDQVANGTFVLDVDSKDLEKLVDLVPANKATKSTTNYTTWLKPKVVDQATGKLLSPMYDITDVVICTDANVYTQEGSSNAVSKKASVTFQKMSAGRLDGVRYTLNPTVTDAECKQLTDELTENTNTLCQVIDAIIDACGPIFDKIDDNLKQAKAAIQTAYGIQHVNVTKYLPRSGPTEQDQFYRLRLIGSGSVEHPRELMLHFNPRGGNKKGSKTFTPVLYLQDPNTDETTPIVTVKSNIGEAPLTVDNIGAILPKNTLIEYLMFSISNITVKATPNTGSIMISLDIQIMELVNPVKQVVSRRNVAKKSRAASILHRKAPAVTVEAFDENVDENVDENLDENGDGDLNQDPQDNGVDPLGNYLADAGMPVDPPKFYRQNAVSSDVPTLNDQLDDLSLTTAESLPEFESGPDPAIIQQALAQAPVQQQVHAQLSGQGKTSVVLEPLPNPAVVVKTLAATKQVQPQPRATAARRTGSLRGNMASRQ